MSDECGYPLVPLHQVARRITDGSHFSPLPREHGHLIANVKDMKPGAIDFSTCTRISLSAYRELKATGCTIKNGNVLLSKDGTVGRVVVYRQDEEIGALSSICIIEPTDRLDPAFLGQALQSEGCTRQYDNFMSGSALRRLVLRDIRSIQVPLPDPERQRTIARVLDTLDTAIHETEAIIAKLKAVKQGLLHDLLTRGIDANGELRPPQVEAPQLYKGSPLGWIPTDWGIGTVSSYLEEDQGIKPGPFGSSIKKDSYSESGFKVYGQEQVISGNQEVGNYFVPLRKYQELQDFSVREGDVLISLVGTIGKVLVLRSPLAPGLINPRLMRLRPHRLLANPEFVGLLVASSLFARQVIANAGGGTMPVLNKRIVSSIRVPVVPLDEQLKILASRAGLEGRILYEELGLKKLHQESAGLMDDLLSGRVRVTPLLEEGERAKECA